MRELKNLITAALAAKTDHSPLGLKDLPQRVWEELSKSEILGRRGQAGLAARDAASGRMSVRCRAT